MFRVRLFSLHACLAICLQFVEMVCWINLDLWYLLDVLWIILMSVCVSNNVVNFRSVINLFPSVIFCSVNWDWIACVLLCASSFFDSIGVLGSVFWGCNTCFSVTWNVFAIVLFIEYSEVITSKRSFLFSFCD